MKISDIKVLAELVSKHNLSAIEINEGDTHIRIENTPAAGQALVQPVPAAAANIPVTVPAPVPASAPAEPVVQPAAPEQNFSAARMVTSPMVGVFYAAPSPDAEPFVKVGQKVRKGDVLCIIEAMKLMNEITAEEDGEIIDVCAANGGVVEYGQTLFKLL